MQRIPPVPYHVVALAPFGMAADTPPRLSRPYAPDELETAMADFGLRLALSVPKAVFPPGQIEITVRQLRDFRPDQIVRNVPALARYREAAQFIRKALAGGVSPQDAYSQATGRWPDVPVPPPPATGMAAAARAKSEAIDDIFSMIALPGSAAAEPAPAPAETPVLPAATWPDALDAALGRILSALFADAGFRTVEAAWRGLAVVTRQGPFALGDGLRIRLAPATPDTLPDALAHLAAELAAEPPNLILVALPFDSTPRSLELLEAAAACADALQAPLVVELAPAFFHLAAWDEIGRLPFLPNYLEDAAFAKWQRLRELPGGAWLAATCNAFAGREVHRSESRQGLTGCDEAEPLWLNPVWAAGALAAQSVARFGWPTHLAEWRQVALHELPLIDTGDLPRPTSAVFPRERLQQFRAAGITPLAVEPGRAEAFIPQAVTVGGGRLEPALYLNRVLAFLIGLRESAGAAVEGDAAAAAVADALALFFAATGGGAPAELSVKTAPAAPDGSVPLYIRLAPPPGVLPSSEPLEFTFAW
jgi:hypothetical protein